MSMKRLGIIVVVVVLFLACFSYLNEKYDRFYRIAGIDNEKRQLILNHLDETEQDYLVEHSIATDRFMKYIEIEDFSLQLIAYYEVMEKSDKVFLNDEHLIKYTNELVAKIKSLTKKNVSNHYKQLLKYNLDEIFLLSENYDLSLTMFYATYKDSVEEMKVDDIDRLNTLNEKMVDLDYIESQQQNFLKEWQETYSLEALTAFLDQKKESPWIELVVYPESLTAIVSEDDVVSSYIPEPLVIPYSVSRVSFGMYLRQDASTAFEQLAKACASEIPNETLLLVGAYQSYEFTETQFYDGVSEIRGGQSEFQLGLSVDLCALNLDYSAFSQTQLCTYLKENSWKYGFIQRYNDIENGIYDEHIYRYVGIPQAKLIYEQQMTLEEYEGGLYE